MDTEEYIKTNGTNFFFITSSYLPTFYNLQTSNIYFKTISGRQRPAKVNELSNLVTPMHYGNFPSVTPCAMLTHYTAFDGSRALQSWPNGLLESYKYPLGRWQQMKENRHVKWVFNGQIDGRWAYDDRRQFLIHNIKPFCDDGAVISRIGEGPEYLTICPSRLLPDGSLPPMCRCYDETRHRAIKFEDVLMQSLFAFHIKGDDYYSARLPDILGAGAVPVVVDHTMLLGLSGQCHIPLKHMFIYVPIEEWMDDPVAAAHRAVGNKSHNEMEKLVRLLEYYRGAQLSGIYGNNRVVEDRLSHMITRCISEDVLRQLEFTKSDMTCDFEDDGNSQAFPRTGDADDVQPPWGSHLTGGV
eukprot:Blabericola_migrator_1__8752@NODE_460_length_8295_cov_270_146208_g162_i1_p4_GENE_NODE_460_length_8295_cov_270_146208_g162_i1NODE_460_length_8295_cov_270_146208_g162_i1_p4_ORF_typecomplete_len356_score29_62Exostosin/PF03016_15/6_3e07MogR_DNAbind/PF12181_8/0_41_NODE_460_length_8295_cov_270_146208_g162_i168917958